MDTLYIGIDDTDNLETRGTGFQARQLMFALNDANLVKPIGITRHQLWFNQRVPYTSHNSSACLAVNTNQKHSVIVDFCRDFLLKIAADGSDVGLCVADPHQAESLIKTGLQAKQEWVDQRDVQQIANQNQFFLQGLTGDHQGIVGALSAVGLFAQGNDGRYIWSQGLRERVNQQVTLAQLNEFSNLDRVALVNEVTLQDPAINIELGDWPRAVRLNHQSVLLVEHSNEHRYKVVDKDFIKSFRP